MDRHLYIHENQLADEEVDIAVDISLAVPNSANNSGHWVNIDGDGVLHPSHMPDEMLSPTPITNGTVEAVRNETPPPESNPRYHE